MIHVNVSAVPPTPTAHSGGEKQVLLAKGIIPKIPQAALVTLIKTTDVHAHQTMWECYYVLEGYSAYVIDGQEVHVQPGDFIAIPPGVPHCQVVNHPHKVLVWGVALD